LWQVPDGWLAIRGCGRFEFRNQQPIRNPKSAMDKPQSAVPNPQSAIGSP
jgi:hypothetical protein